MNSPALGILIMAAGKGTRMKSGLPKVLLPILDKPMLGYLLETVMKYESAKVAVLVGYEGERVCDYLLSYPPLSSSIEILWQKEQLGTGHAVHSARPWWQRFEHVMVLNGDLPFLSLETIKTCVAEHLEAGAACSMLSFLTDTPDGYGRVLRGESGVSVVEHKDATPEQRLTGEVNAGCYVFGVKALTGVIDKLSNDNAQREYYLPDVVALMNAEGLTTRASVVDEGEALGVNTQAELAAMTKRMRDAIVLRWMESGVRVIDPSSVWIGPDAEIAPGVCLMPGVQIWGRSVVGEGSSIGPYCVLRDAVLGRRVSLTANVIIEDSELRDDAKAGPFAYIREHSLLNERAFAGKFVELKKTSVGKGSKVPHLSYMGDAFLGEDVNIGAGSVTCNYDGKRKFQTHIGDRCFVGSDTMMVAPVVLAKDTATAAGSVVTDDVQEGALAVGRARQRNVEGWVFKKRSLDPSLDVKTQKRAGGSN